MGCRSGTSALQGIGRSDFDEVALDASAQWMQATGVIDCADELFS